MNRLKLLLATFMACFGYCIANAEPQSSESQENKSSGVARVVLRHYKGTTVRPNAPSNLYMECMYGEGFVEPVFPLGVYSIEIRIYNDTEEVSTFSTAECAVAKIPSLNGIYAIECTTDEGITYYGPLEF